MTLDTAPGVMCGRGGGLVWDMLSGWGPNVHADASRRIGEGRAAEVFDLGDGTVLRRYRLDRSTTVEGRLMQWLHQAGYPVPRVVRADGRELVMERIDGPTMLDDLGRRPWRLWAHIRLLAALQRRLGALEAPEWLGSAPDVPAGDAVLHLDLHPGNVLLSSRGPVVIDWTNVSRGPAGFDAAVTHVLLSTSEVHRRRERLGQRWVTAVFAHERGAEYAEHVVAALHRRLADPNVTERERVTLHARLARSGR